MRPRTALALAAALLAAACQAPRPRPEPPPSQRTGYLGEGDVARVSGAAGRSLLDEYEATLAQNRDLEERLAATREANEALTRELEAARRESTRERQLRAAADAEIERLAGRARDLETRVLALSVAKVRLEQDLLKARLAVLGAPAFAREPTAAPPTPPPAAPPASER